MQCRVTTLGENTSGKPHIIGEWGFCALIETEHKTVLLDSGAGHGVVHNAEIMGIDFKKVDNIVLSHAHFDHTAGIRQVLKKIGKEIEVIAPLDLWAGKYSVRGGTKKRYIGVPFTRSELESLGARFTMTQAPFKITENMMTTGEVEIVTDFEEVGEDYLLVKDGDEYKRDTCPDDRALIVKTNKGLVVVLGCAHRCLINTLYHAQKVTGEKEIHMVLGGCHLIDASDELIKKTIEALKGFDVKRLGVSHCTGLRAGAMMAAEFGDRFFFNTAGTVVTVS